MVVPAFGGHDTRNDEADDGGNGSCRHRIGFLRQQVEEEEHAEAYPEGKGIEGSGIGVITLTRLVRILVQVNHDGQTRKQEHQSYHPGVGLMPPVLESKAQNAEDERQGVEGVAGLIIRGLMRFQGRVAVEDHVVETFDSCFPVTFQRVAGKALDIVLTADEVPGKIAQVHVFYLVVHEVSQVAQEGRDLHFFHFTCLIVLANFGAVMLLNITPIAVSRFVVALLAPHPREDGRIFLIVYRDGFLAVVGDLVFFRFFVFGIHWLSIAEILLRLGRCIIVLPFDERPIAVLLAVQVRQHRDRILRIILIHRRIGLGADNEDKERRVTDDERGEADEDHIEHIGILLFQVMNAIQQATQHQESGQHAHAGIGGNNGKQCKHDTGVKAELVHGFALLHRVQDESCERYEKQQEVNDRADVEAHAQLINEEDLVIGGKLHDLRDHDVLDTAQQQQGDQAGVNEGFPLELVFFEIINEADRRDHQ